jgi:hypothetical protein
MTADKAVDRIFGHQERTITHRAPIRQHADSQRIKSTSSFSPETIPMTAVPARFQHLNTDDQRGFYKLHKTGNTEIVRIAGIRLNHEHSPRADPSRDAHKPPTTSPGRVLRCLLRDSSRRN